MALERIIDLTITTQTLGVSQAGFGTALIFADPATVLKPGNTFGTNKTKLYTSASDVLIDFNSTDKEYLAAVALMSQNPNPNQFRIALRQTPVATVTDLEFSGALITGNQVQVTVNKVSIEEDFDTDDPTTLTNLAATIAAIDGIASAVAGANKVTITATADYALTVENANVVGGASQVDATVTVVTPGRSIADDYLDAKNEVNDWYAVLTAKVDNGIIDSLARTVESDTKIFAYASSDSNILSAGSSTLPAIFQSRALRRTIGFFHEFPETEFINAAAFGRTLPIDPGAGIMAFKTLAGVTVSPINDSQITSALSINANVYSSVGGRNIIENGQMANGDFYDTVRDIDYLEARLAEDVFLVMVNLEKIPYTQKGIDLLVGVVKNSLDARVTDGILAPGTVEVTAPALADISTNDKANRVLPDVKFTATLAGAIQKIEIDGTISV